MGLQIDENQSKYQIFNLLNDLPFFDNFDDSEKREFVSSENYVLTVDSGSKIVTQGSIEFSLYFLLEGKVIITKNEFPRLVVATLGPGAIFGEISILSQSPRTSNYIARDEVKVLKLNGELFEKLSPPTQIKLNQQLIQVLIDQLESNSFSFLKLKAELDSIAQIGTQFKSNFQEIINKTVQTDKLLTSMKQNRERDSIAQAGIQIKSNFKEIINKAIHADEMIDNINQTLNKLVR